jgi:uncharacterized sporulation protein YeaH/YhbH (DUF444 family)
VGDSLGQGNQEPGQGREAGNSAGSTRLEVEVSLEELAEIMGEELALPRIEPKGAESIETVKEKYTGIRPVGPESPCATSSAPTSRRCKRQVASGTYAPTSPSSSPSARTSATAPGREIKQPQANAVIIYMMDVSGSMGDEQKEIVRIESFWLDTWLRSQYQGVESRYIIHDATAREVDRDTFFHTRESGGTMISSAYKLCLQIIEADYPAEEWNIYPFHFSDGDNWSVDDTNECVTLLRDKIIPASNMFGYGQVESPYGSGQFIKDLREHFPQKSESP